MIDFVIGIGNTLRRDDGIAARLIAELPSVPNVAALAVHQLTPELAIRLCDASRVLFVDAHYTAREPSLTPLSPEDDPDVAGHTLSPAALLGLTKVLCDHFPQGWLLSIPGYDFGFGEELSDDARAQLPAAIGMAVRWMEEAAKTRRYG